MEEILQNWRRNISSRSNDRQRGKESVMKSSPCRELFYGIDLVACDLLYKALGLDHNCPISLSGVSITSGFHISGWSNVSYINPNLYMKLSETIETLKQYVEDQWKPKRHYVKDANQKRWNKV